MNNLKCTVCGKPGDRETGESLYFADGEPPYLACRECAPEDLQAA